MKITALIENTAKYDSLRFEHGLSLYIETEQHKILFDMGQTDAFAENAKTLGIDLSQVDIAVLSHGHYDHGGGILRFLELNKKAPVYVNRRAFDPHFNSVGKYIGLDTAIANSSRLIFTDVCLKPCNNLMLFTCNNRSRIYASPSFGLSTKVNGKLIPDDFCHEQYLMITENGKRILISGCSHKGILNIMHWEKPDIFIGGFHLMKQNDKAELHRYANTLSTFAAAYYTCHCTGLEQYNILKSVIGNRLHYLSAGDILNI